jgi:hypothetical protein
MIWHPRGGNGQGRATDGESVVKVKESLGWGEIGTCDGRSQAASEQSMSTKRKFAKSFRSHARTKASLLMGK